MSLIQTLAVAEYLNFRHAANALGVSQPSVSARIKALEANLGILLFERRARGVRLTQAGRHFVTGIASGVDQLDFAMKTAAMAAAGESGVLRIGVHTLVPCGFLSKLIGRFSEGHPDIQIAVVEGKARDTVSQLRDDQLDIVFVAGTPHIPDCHTRRIWTEQLVATLPSDHPLAARSLVNWADLAGETFLVCHDGTGQQIHNHIALRLRDCWPPSSIRRYNVERSSLLSMVGQGLGITVFGSETSLVPTAGVVFVPFGDEEEPIPFSAIWSPYNRSVTLHNMLALAKKMGR